MKQRAFIFIILAGVLWGTSGIFVNVLAPLGFTSLQMTAIRGAVSLVCIASVLAAGNRSCFKIKPAHLFLCALTGLSFFGTASCYFTSMTMTSISTAVVLMYTAPLYVMAFSVLFLGERFSRIKAVSVFLMLLGCAFVSGLIGGFKFDLMGILIGILAGISYASYNIFSKILIQKGCAPITVTLYTFLFMSLLSLAVCRPQEMLPVFVADTLLTVLLALALGITTSCLPYFFYNFALKDLPAGTASALAIVEPMSATVFGILIFNERPGIFAAIGIVLILLAVFLLGRAESEN